MPWFAIKLRNSTSRVLLLVCFWRVEKSATPKHAIYVELRLLKKQPVPVGLSDPPLSPKSISHVNDTLPVPGGRETSSSLEIQGWEGCTNRPWYFSTNLLPQAQIPCFVNSSQMYRLFVQKVYQLPALVTSLSLLFFWIAVRVKFVFLPWICLASI